MMQEENTWFLTGNMFLCGEKNPYLGLLKEKVSSDPFGLAKLDLFFAEKLFPHFSTLMPNLVYLYLLTPIYDYASENKMAGKERRDYVNSVAAKITTAEGLGFSAANKGFHGNVQSQSVLTDYQDALRYLYLIDMETKMGEYEFQKEENRNYRTFFQKDSEEQRKMTAWCGESKNFIKLRDQLKKTDRYEAIREFCSCNPLGDENDLREALKKLSTKNCPVRLTQEEKKDFLIRLLYRSSRKGTNGRGKIEHNLFEWMCKIYLLDGNAKLHCFENLKGYLEKTGEKWAKEENNANPGYGDLYDYYLLARRCSRLEYLLNLSYNSLLCGENSTGAKEGEGTPSYRELLQNAIKDYQSSLKGEEDPWSRSWDKDIKESLVFLENADRVIRDTQRDLSALSALIVEREEQCLGEKSMLNAKVKTKTPINLSPDTFRWEYRDFTQFNGSDIEKYIKNRNYCKKGENGRIYCAFFRNSERRLERVAISNTDDAAETESAGYLKYCISYFIYELFFEENGCPRF